MSFDALGFLTGKRVVVFGAGYIGSAFCVKAREAGAVVVALTRNPETAARLTASGVETVVANLQSDDWHLQLARADLAVNCVSSGGGGSAGYRSSYIEGLRSIQRWLRRSGKTDTLIYTSSTSVYPQVEGDVTEDSPTDAATGNAALLLEAESIVAGIAVERLASRAVVLRLSGIYGPGRHRLLDQIRAGAEILPGRGAHRLNLIHRDDVVSAIFASVGAKSSECAQIYNVSDDCPTAKTEVTKWLAERLGTLPPRFSGEVISGRRSEALDRTVINRKIKQELSWHPTYPNFRSGYEAILGT